MRTKMMAALAATAGLMSAVPAMAQQATCVRYGFTSGWSWGCVQWGSTGGTGGSGVPEIDASAGLLAVAAVAAVTLIVWERRRRAA